MNPRTIALHEIANRKLPEKTACDPKASEFGQLTFNQKTMEKLLPKQVLDNVLLAMQGQGPIHPAHADSIAKAMKKWAVSHGATHFCHWFQPLTGSTAFKHDAFLDWDKEGNLIESFTGKNLLRGEPDGSSLPSGGLRKTHEARGYTTWDPSSPVFLWKAGGAVVMCIPAVYFSWTGEALDMKIPLLRSDEKIRGSALRLLKLLGIKAKNVFSTLGVEQEYFLLDQSLANLRTDIMLTGRTLFGAPSPKSQELSDHYFGRIKDRHLAFMKEYEGEAIALGIPLCSRHCEVAPHQFETAPIFEKASIGVDHNILLMEVMTRVAKKYQLSCLFHEKPFAGVNGSGKHNNWSLATDTGLNLLDPTANPEKGLLFLTMVAAVLNGVHENAALLRASIASPGNDHRLGGHEAPPPIISVYMGDVLEQLLDHVEKGIPYESVEKELHDLGISSLAPMAMDHADRNRTSPFAFTGNKFEFRAVGSSANCAMPMTVLNVIVADSLNRIVDEMEERMKTKESAELAILAVIRKYLKQSRPIRFVGDNYSSDWVAEAKKRKLPVILTSFEAYKVFQEPKTIKIFQGVLSKAELEARYQVLHESHLHVQTIEANTLIEIFRTQILPVALEYQKKMAKSLLLRLQASGVESEVQKQVLRKISEHIDRAIQQVDALESDPAAAKQAEARRAIDLLEAMLDDREWSLPK